MTNPLLRSVVFTGLLETVPGFGALEDTLATLVITDVVEMAEEEGWTDTFACCQEFARRIAPASVESYARALAARRDRSATTR